MIHKPQYWTLFPNRTDRYGTRSLPRLILLACELLFFFLFAVAVATRATSGLAAESSDYMSQRAELNEQLISELEKIAQVCDQNKLTEQSAITRQWAVRDPNRQYLFAPSGQIPKYNEDELVSYWRRKFMAVRVGHAERLLVLATAEFKIGRLDLAYRLLHEILHENPGHEFARQTLGYQKNAAGWEKKEDRVTVRKGTETVRELKFVAGRYTEVYTPHFVIRTNQAASVAREVAGELEELHLVWEQLFFDYWADRDWFARCWQGKWSKPRHNKRHKIYLFANREQYLATLQPIQSRIGLTTGLYFDASASAYIYANDPTVKTSWFHEVTHQLFQESIATAAATGEYSNFWIVEGIALYMESLAKHEGFFTVGGADAKRLQFARYNLLNGGYYIPSREMTRMSRKDTQESPKIRQFYSQFAGLSHFLMDGDSGKYRPGLLQYLTAVYTDDAGVDSLSKATGIAFEQIDQSYRGFLNVTDQDLLLSPTVAHLRHFSLGRTAVTLTGLQRLNGREQLEWLNVGYTPANDEFVLSLAASRKISELNVEYTKITDASLEQIGRFKDLVELDLSGIMISDGGLKHLAGLKDLKSLWLTNCNISDAGLLHLRTLKKLESLDIDGTKVTQEGLLQLKKSLPNLD
ncbi:MAG: hypothetical protein ACI9G1_000901 [Pirellulaceae bacterium]|jgi:hypothetical protein